MKCPALTRPANGGIVPANCHVGAREFGQRCVSYCKHGYRLRGAATRYCQSDKSWSADSSVQCIKSKLIIITYAIYECVLWSEAEVYLTLSFRRIEKLHQVKQNMLIRYSPSFIFE